LVRSGAVIQNQHQPEFRVVKQQGVGLMILGIVQILILKPQEKTIVFAVFQKRASTN